MLVSDAAAKGRSVVRISPASARCAAPRACPSSPPAASPPPAKSPPSKKSPWTPRSAWPSTKTASARVHLLSGQLPRFPLVHYTSKWIISKYPVIRPVSRSTQLAARSLRAGSEYQREWSTVCVNTHSAFLASGIVPGKHPPHTKPVVQRPIRPEKCWLQRIGHIGASRELFKQRLQLRQRPSAQEKTNGVSANRRLVQRQPIRCRDLQFARTKMRVQNLVLLDRRHLIPRRRVLHLHQRKLSSEARLVELHCLLAFSIEQQIRHQRRHTLSFRLLHLSACSRTHRQYRHYRGRNCRRNKLPSRESAHPRHHSPCSIAAPSVKKAFPCSSPSSERCGVTFEM